MRTDSQSFQPNWTSPPGDSINRILRDRGLTLEDFATLMNLSLNDAKGLILGDASINSNTARELEKALEIPISFWLAREQQYRDNLERLRNTEEDDWLRQLPVRDMEQLGWLRKTGNRVSACLEFFNVPNVAIWRERYGNAITATAFRMSPAFKSERGAISAWIREGEIQSELIDCKPWDAKNFGDTLERIRPLTRKKNPKDFLPRLIEECAACGVALVVIPTPTGCFASGATKFVREDRAMMMLSFRYRSDDQFWFTFFHEAGHLLLHPRKLMFIEDDHTESHSQAEAEASSFSATMVIPSSLQGRLKTMDLSRRSILQLAMEAGVSAGIVVGQLQHIGRLAYHHFNSLKRHYDWNDILSQSTTPGRK